MKKMGSCFTVVPVAFLVLVILAKPVDTTLQRLHAHGEIAETFKRASTAFQEGNLDEAEKIFQELSTLFPDISAPSLNLAVVNEKKGNARSEFPSDYETAISTCRFGANLLNSKYSSTSKMDLDLFLEACKDASKTHPQELEAISMLGNMYVLLMRFEEAIPILTRAEKISRNNRDSHVQILSNIALANLRAGNGVEAIAAAEKLMDLYKHIPGISSTAGNVRSILLPYDPETIKLLRMALKEYIASLKLMDESCPAGKWKMDINWTKGAKYFNKVLLNPSRSGTIYKSEPANIVGTRAEDLSPYYTEYIEREIYFLTLTNAWLWKSNGQLSTPCVVHSAAQMWNAEFGPLSSEISYMQTKRIKHRVASTLPLKNIRNYYHWMLEGMIRLVYIQELVLDLPSYNDVKVLVPDTTIPHVQQSIEFLHIPKNRILIYTTSDNYRWAFEQDMIIIDWIHPVDTIGSLSTDSWSPYYPPQEGIFKLRDRLRDTLMEYDPDFDQKSSGVVFISRDKKKSVRFISNEKVLIAALREAFGENRVTVHRGTKPLHEQLLMFATADIVVGSHGAGLANIVVARPGTPVVFFPLYPHVDRTFGHLCTALDLPQWIVSDVNSYYYGTFGDLSRSQIDLIVTTIQKALVAAQKKPAPRKNSESREEDGSLHSRSSETDPQTINDLETIGKSHRKAFHQAEEL